MWWLKVKNGEFPLVIYKPGNNIGDLYLIKLIPITQILLFFYFLFNFYKYLILFERISELHVVYICSTCIG